MAKALDLDAFIKPLPELLAFSKRVWLDYDREADVLYISFRKPQQANDSELEENIIYHFRDEELVGATIIGWQDYVAQREQHRPA